MSGQVLNVDTEPDFRGEVADRLDIAQGDVDGGRVADIAANVFSAVERLHVQDADGVSRRRSCAHT